MNKYFLIIAFILFSINNIRAQEIKIDGLAAVIGDQAVTQSDINQMVELAKSEGENVTDPCIFFRNMMSEKLLLYKAKQDTTIVIEKDQLEREIDSRVESYKQYLGNDQAILDYFKMKTMTLLRKEIETFIKSREYTTQQRNKIVSNVDISPEYLKKFYEQHKEEFPITNEEIEFSQIVLYPKLTEDHKKQVIDKLSEIKKDVEKGESFATKAKDYSDDPGSAANGGLIEGVKRGMMVKGFEAVSFGLEEGAISEPFETEYGFHIVLLEKKKGNTLSLRHILIKNNPNREEIRKAIDDLEAIKLDIKTEKITFKEAARKYSDDKYTKLNSGEMTNPQTGDSKFDKLNLPNKILYNLSGLDKGDISEVFEDEENEKKIIKLLKVNELTAPHKMNLDTDYSRIKEYAKKQKEDEIISKWIKEQIPSTYIKIFGDYEKCATNDWKK